MKAVWYKGSQEKVAQDLYESGPIPSKGIMISRMEDGDILVGKHPLTGKIVSCEIMESGRFVPWPHPHDLVMSWLEETTTDRLKKLYEFDSRMLQKATSALLENLSIEQLMAEIRRRNADMVMIPREEYQNQIDRAYEPPMEVLIDNGEVVAVNGVVNVYTHDGNGNVQIQTISGDEVDFKQEVQCKMKNPNEPSLWW